MRLSSAFLLVALCTVAPAQNRGMSGRGSTGFGSGRGSMGFGSGFGSKHFKPFPRFPPFKAPPVPSPFPFSGFPFSPFNNFFSPFNNVPFGNNVAFGAFAYWPPFWDSFDGFPSWGGGFGGPGFGGPGYFPPPPQPANVTVVFPPQPPAPPPPIVKIDNTQAQPVPVVQEVSPAAPVPARQPVVQSEYPAIVAIRNGGIYSASTYWSKGKTFHFVTTQGNHIQVASARVERVVPPQRDGHSIPPPPPPRQLR